MLTALQWLLLALAHVGSNVPMLKQAKTICGVKWFF